MNTKRKHGFATFAARVYPVTKTPKSNTNPLDAERLPNGFYVGQRVYYTDGFGSKVYGKVIKYRAAWQDLIHDRSDEQVVWGYWNGDQYSIAYMATNRVFAAEPADTTVW